MDYNSIRFLAVYNAVSKNISTDRSLSGGDRILIELTRKWKNIFKSYTIFTDTSGEKLINTYLKPSESVQILGILVPSSFYNNILLLYLFKMMAGTYAVNRYDFSGTTYLFSSSDFLPDVIPALYAKLTKKSVRWIAAFYFFASSPFSSEFPYKGKGARMYFRGAMYYFTQKLAYFLIKKFADFVILCNEVDRRIFIKEGFPEKRIYPIYGGVDLAEANSVPEPSKKRYDGIFMARFHPQKGPLEAVKVWEEVIKNKPGAQLAMIGNGPVEETVKNYILEKNLGKNITLLGFMDGIEKYKVLKSAKVFLHTAVYETGGMAAAEGMAAGLPVIAFNHEGFDYCYPRGMVRIAPVGDIKKMAVKVMELLDDSGAYKRLRDDAIDFVQEWDWSKRAEFLLEKMKVLE